MAQIIKHRRGTLANLSGVTLNNGELGIVTSSVANVGDAPLKTAIVVGHTDGTNRLPVSRLSYGNAVPNLGGITGGANLNDLIHYDSDNYKLYRLNTGGNTDLDLTGAVANRAISGSLIVTGVVSASSNVWIGGNLHAVGNITFEAGSSGTITLGDSAGDSVSFAADVTSNIIPNASDSYNLGSDSQRWNDLYLSGSISASGGPHAIDSTTSIAMNSTTTTALNATTTMTVKGAGGASFGDDTGTWEFDGSGAVSETGMTTFAVTPSSTLYMQGGGVSRYGDDTSYWSFDGSGAVSETGMTSFTLNNSGTLTIQGGGVSKFGDDTAYWSFDGSGALSEIGMTTVSVTPSSTVDIDSGGAVTIDSSAAAISVGGDSVGQKITVGGDTSTRTEVELNAILVDINAGATGVTIDTLDAGAINIGTSANAASDTSAINIGTSATARTVTIGNAASTAVNANALAITLTSVNALQLTDGTATFQLGGTGATTLSGGTTTDIDGSGALSLNSTAGAINIGNDDIDQAINIGTQGERTISVGTGAFADTINIGNATGATAVSITSGTGHIALASTSTGDITINSADTVLVDSAGVLELNSSAGAISIGNDGVAQKITVGGDTGTRTEIELNAILIDINGGASGVTIDGGASSNFTTSGGTVTVSGKTGVAIQEDGTDVIGIDTNRDVLFSQTGGATGDPDVEFDGYVRFDGITEVANTTTSTTSGTGALLVDGGIGVAENVNIGGNLTVTGDYTVNGTTTFISSSTLDIGDNIISVNSVSPVRYGGLHVHDVNAGQTGSFVWDSTNDYWVAGQSGSEYRVPVQVAVSNLTENKPVIVDGSGRLESSANITDDGATVDFGDVNLTSIDKLEGFDTNTYIDLGASTLIVTKGTIQPAANNGDDLGATGTRYKNLWLQGNADLEGDIDVNGTANLDVTDIDGTLDVAGVTDFQARVDAQASLHVTGSLYASTGAAVASGSSVAFHVPSSTQLGYMSSADTQAVTTGLIGYNTSTGLLTVSSVIDGGSF